MPLEIRSGYSEIENVKELFTEYTDMLMQSESRFKEYFGIQNYSDELEHPEQKYGPPGGRLYIAYYDGRSAGCIALRPLGEEICEMKRLYVRPEFRGKRIGDALVKLIIEDARQIGYKKIMLDTMPFLKRAIEMYKNLGFKNTERYNDSPMDDTIYLSLDL